MDTGEFDDFTGSNAGYTARKNLVQGSALVSFLAELQWDLASSFKGLFVNVQCKCEFATVDEFE